MPVNSPAINGSQSSLALHPTIRASGIKGFLQWMKADPTMGKVYQAIAPQLPALLSASGLAGRRRGMGSLGCCCGGMASFGGCCSDFLGSCDSFVASAPTDATNSSALTGALTSLVSVGESAALSANQIANANAVTSAQLAQAAAGRPPLALTVPFGTTGSTTFSSSTLLLLGAAALVLVLMMGGKKV